jgi:hypothetical protein
MCPEYGVTYLSGRTRTYEIDAATDLAKKYPIVPGIVPVSEISS